MRSRGGILIAVCVLGLAAIAWAEQARETRGEVKITGRSAITGTVLRIEGNRLTVREEGGGSPRRP